MTNQTSETLMEWGCGHTAKAACQQCFDARCKEIVELKENETARDALIDLQWRRMVEATKLWQEATGEHLVHPDLGDLLTWLMAQIPKGGAV